jgi:Cof subfamily protein (haloacid dehalogenase superfamily)
MSSLFFLSDVDGSLFTPDRVITPRSLAAVRALEAHGIGFSIVSGRPPIGMKKNIAQLGLKCPVATFNGGKIIRPDLSGGISIIEEHLMESALVRTLVQNLAKTCADVWVYRGDDWLLRDASAPHVSKERESVGFAPTRCSLAQLQEGPALKIVAVSDDPECLENRARELRREFEGRVSARLSQFYYLDITHPKANKEAVVRSLSRLVEIPPERFVTLGDMTSDIPMFQASGYSIAMGQASAEVRAAATYPTLSNSEEGFAHAVEDIIIPLATRRIEKSA